MSREWLNRAMTWIVIGALSGFLAGLLGIGGGGLMVPMLVSFAGVRQRDAHAISLGAVVLLALAAAITYGASDEVRLGTAVALFFGGVVGAPIGALLLSSADDRLARRAFGALLLATSIYLVLT
jgi:uncharacterized membrane protein YfcA